MEHPPKIFFTPPPGASLPPGASPAPSARPLLAASPGASPSPAASASPSPSPSVGPSPVPGAIPTPAAPASPGKADLASPEPSPSPGSQKPKVRVKADTLTTNRQTGITTFRGNVRVDYGDVTIVAEELNIDQRAQTISTNTRFTLTQPDPKHPGSRQEVSGTGLVFHYDTRESVITSANLATPAEYPGQTVYIRAKSVKGFGETRFEASDTVFTTCDEVLEEKVPHYHVESKYMQYYAGDKVVVWDSKVFINGRYVFWLPVWVIPLKGEQNSLNVGRSEVEGFFLRTFYNYALPAFNNGYWLNDGRLFGNVFEKKGLGTGFEHTARWGYDATSYAFFYGLLTPDRTNLIPPNMTSLSQETQDALVARNRALFDLYGGPFQDRQYGIEHRQRLFGDMEIDARVEDHNLYDPISHNFRNNRHTNHVDLKDTVAELGGMNYTLSYDGTQQRGQQVPVDPSSLNGIASLNQTATDRARGTLNFKALNTTVQLTSQYDRTHQLTRQAAPSGTFSVKQAEVPVEYEVRTLDGTTNSTVANTFNTSSDWGPNTRSTLNVPYRITINEPAPPTPAPPGRAATPVVTPSPNLWDQQAEPQLDLNHRIQDVGTLALQAQKFLDLTQYPTTATPQAIAQRIQSQNKFDRLPEMTFTSEQLFQQWQPITAKVAYGRFFEYSSWAQKFLEQPATSQETVNPNFPGNFVNRFNFETSMTGKPFDIGFNSKLDFGGTGYKQFFYSTNDAQYAFEERARLVNSWTDKIETSFNYTNTVTPPTTNELVQRGIDPATFKFTNNSPFQQDRLSLSKQTRLTGSFDVRNDPFLTYALRGGYDYQTHLYDNISSEVTWRNRIFGLPFGMTLNGQYDIQENDEGGLKFERKTLDVRYLPKVPTFGIAGQWLPVTGTFTLRSTEDVFGGLFGSNTILPGWQFDNALGYDFDKGLWTALTNRLYITLGDRWQNHIELMLGGYYDPSEGNRGYKFSQIGINKDLHDFVLSFQYDRLASFYSLSLSMVAFPSQPLSFTSNTFQRRTGAGGSMFGQQ